MKLCILNSKIDSKPLYTYSGTYLYNVPIVDYKKYVLKGIVSNDDEANAVICKLYTVNILGMRHTPCEEYIIKSISQTYEYAYNFGRFIEGEDIISKNAYTSYMYTRFVTKCRLVDSEGLIKDSVYKDDYEERFNIKL